MKNTKCSYCQTLRIPSQKTLRAEGCRTSSKHVFTLCVQGTRLKASVSRGVATEGALSHATRLAGSSLHSRPGWCVAVRGDGNLSQNSSCFQAQTPGSSSGVKPHVKCNGKEGPWESGAGAEARGVAGHKQTGEPTAAPRSGLWRQAATPGPSSHNDGNRERASLRAPNPPKRAEGGFRSLTQGPSAPDTPELGLGLCPPSPRT